MIFKEKVIIYKHHYCTCTIEAKYNCNSLLAISSLIMHFAFNLTLFFDVNGGWGYRLRVRGIETIKKAYSCWNMKEWLTTPPHPQLFSIIPRRMVTKVAANNFTHHLKQFWHKLVACYTSFKLQDYTFSFTHLIWYLILVHVPRIQCICIHQKTI